jgi:hypothetical protein
MADRFRRLTMSVQAIGAEDPSTASATVVEDTSIRPEGDPDV